MYEDPNKTRRDVGGYEPDCNVTTGEEIPQPAEGLDWTKITVLSLITGLTLVGNFLVILAIVARNMKITRQAAHRKAAPIKYVLKLPASFTAC